jgi:uncharacterized membrane protein YedE/YeeE
MTRGRAAMGQSLVALAAGLLFGAGLIVSGMTRPGKVIAFLDVFGAWDASLMFVMIGAIAVHFVAYRIVSGRTSPLLAQGFSIPTRRDIDAKLLLGALVFGAGWGLGGYCPGPAVTSLASGSGGVFVFVAAMLAGLFGTAKLESAIARAKVRASEPHDRAESATTR